MGLAEKSAIEGARVEGLRKAHVFDGIGSRGSGTEQAQQVSKNTKQRHQESEEKPGDTPPKKTEATQLWDVGLRELSGELRGWAHCRDCGGSASIFDCSEFN